MATKSAQDQPPAGLILSPNDNLRSFLAAASQDKSLSHQLQTLAVELSSTDQLPYKAIREIWVKSDPSSRPDLITLFSGSNFILPKPKPREKSEELKSRLKKLQEKAEKKAYEELVKDVAPSKNKPQEPFSSYKDQLGFGLHVILTMFTGYLVGYAAFRALFGGSIALSAAGGVLGLVFAMLVETMLFIIRSNTVMKHPPIISNVKKNQ